MESLLVVVSLVLLAVAVAPIVALVIVYRRVRELRVRVEQLEDDLAHSVASETQRPLSSPAPSAPRRSVQTKVPSSGPFFVPPPPPVPIAQAATSLHAEHPEKPPVSYDRPKTEETPAAVRPTYRPSLQSEELAPPAVGAVVPNPRPSLEARLGQNWLNKLGIVALVIGLALGLGKVITTLGPLGKVAIGFMLALGILGLGVFLERKPTYKLFARVLIGGGWALIFFLSFALYHVPLLQVLHSETVDLILMFLVAGGMVLHSLRYHSQTVTTLAFLLAFVTVGLSEVTLFSLLAGMILTVALSFIVYRERWYALGLAGLVGVYLNHYLWLHRLLPHGGIAYLRANGHTFPEFVPSAALLLFYWLIFRLIYVLRPPLAGPDWKANQTLSTAAALLNAAGLLGLLKYQSSHPEWAFYGLIALGLVEMALSLVARGGLKPDAEAQPNRAAFITLSTLASIFLLAAIPFHFHGNSWSLFWLLEAETFFLIGIRLPERVFRRLGLLGSLVTGVATFSLQPHERHLGSYVNPVDPNAHATHVHNYTILLLTVALILWFNAEFATRRWHSITLPDFDRLCLRFSSYLAAAIALFSATVAIPLALEHHYWLVTPSVCITWLILALLLGFIADRISSNKPGTDLATQSDLAALIAIFTAIGDAFRQTPNAHSRHATLVATGLIAALVYLATHRRTRSYLLPAAAIAPAYSTVAAAYLALQFWYHLEPVSVAVAWGVFGLILFELSYLLKRNYLRRQGYAILAAAFVRIFFANLGLPGHASLYTVLPLIAAFAWVYERIHADDSTSRSNDIASQLSAWCSLVAAGTLVYFELRPSWIILAWTLFAIALLALACALKRTIFIAQSLVVLLAVALRGILYHLFSPTPLAERFSSSRTFIIAGTSAMLLLALPLAFHLRRYFHDHHHDTEQAKGKALEPQIPAMLALLHHPEQPFFFVPLTLITLLLYAEFSGGGITISWVILGLITFLFALLVKERPYRLSGLGLLLLGVAKVLAWDVWHVSPTDRYLTLIIMGAALLLVSFLYSRFRETLLNFL